MGTNWTETTTNPTNYTDTETNASNWEDEDAYTGDQYIFENSDTYTFEDDTKFIF